MTRILILDDQNTNRRILARLAEDLEAGIKVFAFSDGVEALVWAVEDVPDLVVTDYNMPRLNGAEFIRRLRWNSKTADVPVIVVTAFEDSDIRKAALEAGATDFILSPVDPWEFRIRASNLLKLRSQQLMIRRQMLRETEQRYRALSVAVADYAVVSTDLTGLVVSWNASAERLTGLPLVHVKGRNLSDVMQWIGGAGDKRALPELFRLAERCGRSRAVGVFEGPFGVCRVDSAIVAVQNEYGVLVGFSVILRELVEGRSPAMASIGPQLRNCLQILGETLCFQAGDGLADPAKTDLVVQARIDALSIVSRHIKAVESDFGVFLKPLFRDFANLLPASYGLSMDVEFDLDRDCLFSPDRASGFGLILNEFLVSSRLLRDVTPGPRNVVCRVASQDGDLIITYCDPVLDGQPFVPGSESSRRLVDSLVGRIGATWRSSGTPCLIVAGFGSEEVGLAQSDRLVS